MSVLTPDRPRASPSLPQMLSKGLDYLGRTLITAGTLILLFVVYQLWGTGLQEAKSQKTLAAALDDTLAEAKAAKATSTTTTTTTTAPPTGSTTTPLAPVELAPEDLPLPAYGEAIARIKIPAIGVDKTVVEGVGLDQLKRGPGHYPETPLPGQRGNASIAGHRTTYGAPFHNLDKLAKGDRIEVTTVQGTFVYEVADTKIVGIHDVDVLGDKGDNRLTLTACHPKYSAKQRIIVAAVLKGTPRPPIVGQAEAQAKARAKNKDEKGNDAVMIDGGLSGVQASKTPAIAWGLACAAIWLVAWALRRLLRRRNPEATGTRRLVAWLPYVVLLPCFVVALYVFFENFARLLPANY